MKTAAHLDIARDLLQERTADLFSPPGLAQHFRSIADLLSTARALVGTAPATKSERALLQGIPDCTDRALLKGITDDIWQGNDPLGAAYCALRSAKDRRPTGQTFTPDVVLRGMINWAACQSTAYARVVDAGAGSGRYTFAALQRFPRARAVAVELDPILAIILRANAQVLGLAHRIEFAVADFRTLRLPAISGKTLFIGNPPYVRHHGIGAEWKTWYSNRLKALGHGNSQLAGLHLHFFAKVLELARKGDEGCFITSAEWLDVNYGRALRDLLVNGLGGKAVFVVAPEFAVFDDAMVSAAITCFAPGTPRKTISFKRIKCLSDLAQLEGGRAITIEKARVTHRWTPFLDAAKRSQQKGMVALGDLFQVRRGQVTGLNRVWIAGPDTPKLPQRFLVPCITDSFDISGAPENCISSLSGLSMVVDLPAGLDELRDSERQAVELFLEWAEIEGAANGYIAKHRKPWWKVNLKNPAPLVMTYMGRRPPVFARNAAGARLINVAHGLYPKQSFSEEYLLALVHWLNANVTIAQGRTYAGGLTKFEPSEVMRLMIPTPTMLLSEKYNNASLSKTRERVDHR